MPISWNNKEYQPEQVVKKIESARKPGGDGREVQFEGWGFHSFVSLIYSMLDFSDELPEIDARDLVRKAIFFTGKKGAITTKSLLAELNRLEKEYNSLPCERYILLSSISISPFWEIKKIKTGSTLIVFEKSPPSRFCEGRQSLLNSAQQTLFADLPSNYLNVRVFVAAKTIHHAADQALETLDFTRGIWNWLLNRRYGSRKSSGKPQPVNNIILGPIHTLHQPSGKPAASDVWWYEANYLGPVKLFTPTPTDIESINKSFDYVRRALKKHKYPQLIQNAIIRYTRALDERDWTTAFLKLWSILELLTDTGKNSYDVTIKRTAFLYREHEYHLQVLMHLKKYRNLSIHLDKENSEIETYLYQLKGYVESLLHFHIINMFGFETVHEAAEFLDLPYEEEVLFAQEKAYKEQIKRRSLVRKFFEFNKGD